MTVTGTFDTRDWVQNDNNYSIGCSADRHSSLDTGCISRRQIACIHIPVCRPEVCVCQAFLMTYCDHTVIRPPSHITVHIFSKEFIFFKSLCSGQPLFLLNYHIVHIAEWWNYTIGCTCISGSKRNNCNSDNKIKSIEHRPTWSSVRVIWILTTWMHAAVKSQNTVTADLPKMRLLHHSITS